MTIILGFTCSGAVVLASDSQVSHLPTTRKQPDVRKVIAIDLGQKRKAMIARAGNLETAEYFQEFFEIKAKGADLSSQRAIPDLAEAAMRETRSRLMSQRAEAGFDRGSNAQRLMDSDCEIIFGYMHGDTPYVYYIRLDDCLAIKNTNPFLALGCAAGVASVILAGHNLSALPSPEAVGLAMYAIETCKQHDYACSGRTQYGYVLKTANGGEDMTYLGDPFFAEKIVKGAEKTTKEMQAYLRSIVAENMTRSVQ